MNYVKVAVFSNIDTILTYKINEDAKDKTGCRVIIPLGRKYVSGIITGLIPRGGNAGVEESRIKEIKEVIDEKPVLNSILLKLGEWMSSYYLSSPGSVYSSMLAPFRGVASKTEVKLIAENTQGKKLTPAGKEIMNFLLLRRGKKADVKAIAGALGLGRGTCGVAVVIL